MPNGVKPTNGNWVIPNELGNELGQVVKGTRNPWSVTPYTIWRPREFLLGNGFNYTALTRMVRFAKIFPDTQIVATLSQQLSWSHFKEILPLKKPFQRDFYAEMCRIERWSVRTLRKKIDGML